MNSATAGSKVYLAMWFCYPLLVPFFLMGKTPVPGQGKVEGGVPQLADYFLAGFMGLVFAKLPFRLSRPFGSVVAALASFVCYTALINATWTTALEDLSLLKSTLFYAYDVLLFVTCLILYGTFKERFLQTTVAAVAASVLLQALLSPLAPRSDNVRQELFFNNENQLGYFCVLAATIFVVGSRRFAIPLRYQLLFYGAVGYLAVLSQCRSALLALAVLTFLLVIGRPFLLLLALGGCAFVYLVLTLDPPLVYPHVERLVVQGEYDTLATRGYDRIVNHPEHILCGAGEGAYTRFHSDLYGSELHSSFGTLLFCYGLPGTCFFTAALFWICKSNLKIAVFLVPAFVHGSAHQGLRFAFFWTMLAFVCCSALAPPMATPAAPGTAPENPGDQADEVDPSP